jgi:predicted PurR-regulated permease PerM
VPTGSTQRDDLRVIKVSTSVIAGLLAVFAARVGSRLLIPITLSLLVSYALEPLVALLEARRVPRGVAAVFVLILTSGGLGVAAYGLWNQANAAAAKVTVG